MVSKNQEKWEKLHSRETPFPDSVEINTDRKRFFEKMRETGRKYIEHLGLEEGDTLLELGPGNYGVNTLPAAEKGINVIGLEISRKAIKNLSNLLERKGLEEKVRLINTDINHPFPLEQKVDAVICTRTLFHVENIENVITESRKAVKQGGKVHLNHIWNLDSRYMKNVKKIYRKIHGDKFFSPTPFREIKEAGVKPGQITGYSWNIWKKLRRASVFILGIKGSIITEKIRKKTLKHQTKDIRSCEEWDIEFRV